jgi:ATP-binding cassette subfamily F protein uup
MLELPAIIMTPLVSLKDITQYSGTRCLFDRLSLVLTEGERVAIIGPNGAGKSTILRMIAGEAVPEEGEVIKRRGLRVGFAPQSDQFEAGDTVAASLERACGVDERERMVAEAIGLAEFPSDNQLVDSQQVSQLSGGWRKRLAIVRSLLSEPELLLLDEPTNHLDIDGVEWLRKLLLKFSGSAVFISHDRYFIDQVAERVIEINPIFPGGIFSCNGNYSQFTEARAEYLEQLARSQEALANRVRREVEWLHQGAKARTTKQKARIDQAHRMIGELKSIDLRERRVDFELGGSGRKSKELIRAEKIAVKYGDKSLLDDLSLIITPQSRIGVVGPNGSGKSTLIRALLKEHPVASGRILNANKLATAVFDQGRTAIDLNQNLKSALSGGLSAVVFEGQEIHITGWAKRFLFDPNQLTQPLTTLSGGELARVYLSKMMLSQADVLLLDEPTNDLDIQTLEVLEASIEAFPGAVIVVTHDRYLLDRIADTVIGLFGNGHGGVFASFEQFARARNEALKPKPSAVQNRTECQRREGRQKREGSAKLTYAERLELERIEGVILTAEAQAEELQGALNDPNNACDHKKISELAQKLQVANNNVEELYLRWQYLEKKREGAAE